MLPFFGLPAATWLGLVGAPLSISAAKILLANPETPREIVPAQAQTLLAFVVMAAGVGAGFITAAIWS
jgi:hypothetical protein